MEKEFDPFMHSAEHILSGTMVRLFGCGRPFTTHLEKKKSKVDYRFTRALTPEEVRTIEDEVNRVIAHDLPVTEQFLTYEEASHEHDLRRLPDDAAGTIRVVRIGNYDACPCSGPHVRSTGDVGRFRIISTTYEDGALRVRFKLDRS